MPPAATRYQIEEISLIGRHFSRLLPTNTSRPSTGRIIPPVATRVRAGAPINGLEPPLFPFPAPAILRTHQHTVRLTMSSDCPFYHRDESGCTCRSPRYGSRVLGAVSSRVHQLHVHPSASIPVTDGTIESEAYLLKMAVSLCEVEG